MQHAPRGGPPYDQYEADEIGELMATIRAAELRDAQARRAAEARQPDRYEADELAYLQAAVEALERQQRESPEGRAQTYVDGSLKWVPPHFMIFNREIVPARANERLDAAIMGAQGERDGRGILQKDLVAKAHLKEYDDTIGTFEAKHPIQATLSTAAGDFARSATASRLGVHPMLASGIYGAIDGAAEAPPGQRFDKGMQGAIGAIALDAIGKGAADTLGLKGMPADAVGSLVSSMARGELGEQERPPVYLDGAGPRTAPNAGRAPAPQRQPTKSPGQRQGELIQSMAQSHLNTPPLARMAIDGFVSPVLRPLANAVADSFRRRPKR